MFKLALPTVTLMCIDCVDAARAIKVLEHCKTKADFGDVKLLTSIPAIYEHRVKIKPLDSLIMYSIFMLTEVYKYIDTKHVLIVQRDGWILNPEAFKPEWLELDYIGPLFMQYDKVGSGGFSLRSKKLMEAIAATMPEWDGSMQDAHRIQNDLSYYEDGVLSFGSLAKHSKIASLNEAAKFAQGGNTTPLYFEEKPFGFHRTWQLINFITGQVDSSGTSRDIRPTYDDVIDKL